MKIYKIYFFLIISFFNSNFFCKKENKKSTTSSIEYTSNFNFKKALKIASSIILTTSIIIYGIKVFASKLSDEDLRKIKYFSNIFLDYFDRCLKFYLLSSDHKFKMTGYNNSNHYYYYS